MVDEGQLQELPMPNIDNKDELKRWLKSVRKIPPAGYDAMTHPDGTPFTDEEQIETFINQTLDVVEFKRKRGTPDSELKQMLKMLADPKPQQRGNP